MGKNAKNWNTGKMIKKKKAQKRSRIQAKKKIRIKKDPGLKKRLLAFKPFIGTSKITYMRRNK